MTLYDFARWLHVIGACVLLGTGSGIAFFMVLAHRTGRARIVAHVASSVVVADFVFTATAVMAQPLTGMWLASIIGVPLDTPWLLSSILLYLLTGAFWLPVVWIQIRMRDWREKRRRTTRCCRRHTFGCTGSGSPAAYPLSRRCWQLFG